ncbi:hypothetical protein RJ639_016791 [Escallonia herrerae]|uniref:Tetraspanin n=1 Tax=Escallonia herrerae TaxID=1293975 RepID=A0AA88VCY2_9ASTE|nr:hypothetical protein RJ639_016782 [Escallonia herrerae]KAK3005387.1 hypothetical protein RJ639_016791 [Escallonia herrerae]
MRTTAKPCSRMSLKLANSALGVAGIAMILYSLWMIRVWQRDAEGSSFDDHPSAFPWFIHAFLSVGITLCAIACLGHVAADTANPHCLAFHMVLIFLLLLLETGIIADVFLNSDWEKDFPKDPSGTFDDFKDFVKSNQDVCQWVCLLIITAQGASILFATVLRTLGTDQGTDNVTRGEYRPLLYPPVQPFVYGDPEMYPANKDWEYVK